MRQGVANLYRPRNQTLAVTLSLGFGGGTGPITLTGGNASQNQPLDVTVFHAPYADAEGNISKLHEHVGTILLVLCGVRKAVTDGIGPGRLGIDVIRRHR